MSPRFSPTERVMMDILSDGQPHTREELHGCLQDDMQPLKKVRQWMTKLRKKLRPHGQTIRTERTDGLVCYRLTRTINQEA